MLQLRIDANDFIEQSSLSQEDISGFHALLLDRLAEGFKENWINQVNENLHSTRNEYMRGMYSDRPDDNTVVMGVIATKSQLAVDLELGKNAFDEKIGFAMSPKRTVKANGKGFYITIPFRHAVPTAIGESPAFADVMPVSVYKIAKAATRPVSLKQLPADQQVKGVREGFNSGGRSFRAYQHKTAQFEGLTKVLDKDENRAGYMTFRRVSDLTDRNAFIHPGFLPRNFLGKALDKTDVTAIIRRSKIEFFNNR
jgi:hypothetical protein